MKNYNKIALNTYNAEKNKLLDIGYDDKDAQNTALDSLILKIVSSIAEPTAPFGQMNITTASSLIKGLPGRINIDNHNYADIAYYYLTYAIDAKHYINTRSFSKKAYEFAERKTNELIDAGETMLAINHSICSDIAYSDKECNFMAAIGSLIMSRHFESVKADILREWIMDIRDIYFIDEYRKRRITDVLAASYDERQGFIRIVNQNSRKTMIIDLCYRPLTEI